jgi:hypothetical protein
MMRSYPKDLRRSAEPGFALVMVLFLSVLITTMIPLMLNLNRESVTNVQQNQSRALAEEYARQVFMATHVQMLMSGGLPLGWSTGDDTALTSTSAIADLASCSGFMDLSETWDKPDARVSWMKINDAATALNGSKIIAGIYRTSYGDVPYEHYIVLGCVISGGALSQGAAVRGEYAIADQQVLMLSLRAESS